MIVIGLMSGTSIDAIDAAAARFIWRGDTLVMQPCGHRETEWPTDTRQRLYAALPPAPVGTAELCALHVLVGEAFAAAAQAMQRIVPDAALVASHGQTLFHWVENGVARGSLQLGQSALIAEATGLPVIADFRARDIAAGGQGAPLASTFDALWLGGDDQTRVALNLGGIANITVVGPDSLLAYDTGPASCLLDLEAQRLSHGALACDQDGRMAQAGTVRTDLLNRLLDDPYYARPAPKSTGREHYNSHYLSSFLEGLRAIDGPDLMATLTELTAITVAEAVHRHGACEVLASGGGVRNPALMAALARRLQNVALRRSAERGMPEQAKEAYLFALLGFLSWHGLHGALASATGAQHPSILGHITPGREALRLPDPACWPRRLVIEPPSNG